nr:putative RNA-dependent RNA polymerase [Rhizoctonia solani mitovirus 121]
MNNLFQTKTQFNLLEIVRSTVVNVKSMVPLTEKFLGSATFLKTIRVILYLAIGRTSGLVTRARSVNVFLDFVLKLRANHGSTFTIKWLKAGYVAIQKELGQDRLVSLRILDSELPLPRLNNGLPRGIPISDRALIRSGDVPTIRFWSSLFNLYRILEAEPKFKLETITNPLSVPDGNITNYINIAREKGFAFFSHFKIQKQLAARSLSPVKLELSKAASPNSKVSAFGILTDIHSLVTYRPDLWEALHHFAYSTLPEQTPFMEMLVDGYDIITELAAHREVIGKSGRRYTQFDAYQTKASVRVHGAPTETYGLGQFAVKMEPAGKVRLFALMDGITQSFLRPLHNALFDLLRAMPNDGTFDQDASVKRCMTKATKAGCAYSFDLTAATDRLPASLSSEILGSIFENQHLPGYWLKIMTDRSFGFNEKVAGKFNIPDGPYRYAVGQPMGGLSSWPALAVTHHWILQLSASRALGYKGWYDNYEILGDDLVMFDKAVADEYLAIMSELGCEINLSKSIRSHSRPVFEFAKRTCWGDKIVSGISMAQLNAAWNVGSRVGNALAFSRSGLITSPSVLLAVLSKSASKRASELKSHITQLGLLSLLGSLYQSGKASLEELVTAVVDPKWGIDFSDQAVGLPPKAVLEFATQRLNVETHELGEGNPWPKSRDRAEFFFEHQEFLVVKTLSDNVAIAQDLVNSWKKWVRWGSEQLFIPLVPEMAPWNERRFDKTVTLKEINKLVKRDYPVDKFDHQLAESPDGYVLSYRARQPSLELSSYIDDLPDSYQELVYRMTEWWGSALGLGVSTDDPAELLEEAMDMLEQFQYDQMLTLEEAMAFQERLTRFEQQVNFSTPVERTEISESTPILSYLRTLFGRQYFKGTGGLGA